jgi:hypothetical protein
MKEYFLIFKAAGLAAFIAASISVWIFMGGWNFLPIPILAGLLLAIIQNENKVYKYLGKIIFGSLLFGFLAAFLAQGEMYLISNLIFKSGMPFMVTYNPLEYIMFSLVFSFICFLAGLAGVVIKGFISLYKGRKVRLAPIK